MGKKTKKKKSTGAAKEIFAKPPGRLGKWNVIAFVVLVIGELIYYYAATPAINIQSTSFWVWMVISVALVGFCTLDFTVESNDTRSVATKATKPAAWIVVIMIAVGLIMVVASSKLFCASKYASLINIEDGDFQTDIPESRQINDIALMDTSTARIIGERAVGSLSDVVSQYEVSGNYSTIDYNGAPMKVAALNYAGFIKYMNNRKNGIPGYVLVDPVKNEAHYIQTEKPIVYSPSAYFNKNLYRHVQMAYPTYIFEGFYLELSDDGNPYYICPVLESHAGLFGAKDVKGVVICDPCTGDTEYHEVSDVPHWVDRVYDGDLVCQKYDWYGELSGGYWNSVFGNKGCKRTTDDYGYKVMDGDVWVYTGVTSVNGDESNIGFALMNLRTGEGKYYKVAGAEEYSAMSSAEGQVQHLGYKASFPSLINISGIPTYIMVLKDNGGLVKMYALVDVEKYNIVATGTTQKDALAAYNKLLAENGLKSTQSMTDDIPNRQITVADIKYINMDETTYVYITDENGNVYKQDFSENEELIFIQSGDKIKVFYQESDNGINDIISVER